jgi:hypothetical protein
MRESQVWNTIQQDSFVRVMDTQFASRAPERTQAHLQMLKASLKAVFRPADQQGFEHLLRQLDRSSPAR